MSPLRHKHYRKKKPPTHSENPKNNYDSVECKPDSISTNHSRRHQLATRAARRRRVALLARLRRSEKKKMRIEMSIVLARFFWRAFFGAHLEHAIATHGGLLIGCGSGRCGSQIRTGCGANRRRAACNSLLEVCFFLFFDFCEKNS